MEFDFSQYPSMPVPDQCSPYPLVTRQQVVNMVVDQGKSYAETSRLLGGHPCRIMTVASIMLDYEVHGYPFPDGRSDQRQHRRYGDTQLEMLLDIVASGKRKLSGTCRHGYFFFTIFIR